MIAGEPRLNLENNRQTGADDDWVIQDLEGSLSDEAEEGSKGCKWLISVHV